MTFFFLFSPEPFDASQPLIVFDGVCVLCSGFVRTVVRLDAKNRFRFATAQSPFGEALFHKYGLRTDSYETNLVLIGGAPFMRLDSLIAAWRANSAGRGERRKSCCFCRARCATGSTSASPKTAMAIFGRKDSCEIPSPRCPIADDRLTMSPPKSDLGFRGKAACQERQWRDEASGRRRLWHFRAGRIVQLLENEPRLTLIVAGRSQAKAEAWCTNLCTGAAELVSVAFDRDGDLAAQFGALKPDLRCRCQRAVPGLGVGPLPADRGLHRARHPLPRPRRWCRSSSPASLLI